MYLIYCGCCSVVVLCVCLKLYFARGAWFESPNGLFFFFPSQSKFVAYQSDPLLNYYLDSKIGKALSA